MTAATKAIELDDSLADAHRSLAFDEVWRNWNFKIGGEEFHRAMLLNPQDPVTHLWFANAFAAPGWYEVTLQEIDRAQELDPSSNAILADKGLMLSHAGKTSHALELLLQVELADPEFLPPHNYLAEIYWKLRDYPAFLMESDREAALTHDEVRKQTAAAERKGFERDGERGLFRELYSVQKKQHAKGQCCGTALAITCARLGKREEALHLLYEDYERHDAKFLMSRDNFDLLTLKNEPAYKAMWSKIPMPSPGRWWVAERKKAAVVGAD